MHMLDPWAEMSDVLAGVPLPPTEGELVQLLEHTFARLVRAPIGSPESSIFVKRYSHGGMSTGLVSFAFRQEIGLPLSRARYLGA